MKKICLCFAVLFSSGVWAQGTLWLRKDDGARVATINRMADESYVLRVGGFDINFRGTRQQSAQQTVRRYRRTISGNTTSWAVSNNETVDPADWVFVSQSENPHGGNFRFGFIGLDGRNDFMTLDNGRSISVGFDISYSMALNKARNIRLSTAISPRWDNYVFSENITLLRGTDGRIYPTQLGNERIKKSKLGVFSIDMPVNMQFVIARRITFSTGLYGGVKLGDRTKYKFPKYKDKGDWRTEFWQAGAQASLKIHPVPLGIFARYSFTPLFQRGAGPRVQPFTFGITL